MELVKSSLFKKYCERCCGAAGIIKILLPQKAEHRELLAMIQCRRQWRPAGNYKQNAKEAQRKGKPDLTFKRELDK